MRSLINVLALALVLCGLCGCDGEVDQPLSDPMTAEADEDLLGHWRGNFDAEDKKAKVFMNLFIGKHKEKGNPDSIMELLCVTEDLSNKTIGGFNQENFFGQTRNAKVVFFSISVIGKLKFINLFWDTDKSLLVFHNNLGSYKKWAKSETRSCSVFEYKTDGDKLTITPVQTTAKFTMSELVKAGELEEENKKITASSLIKYIKSNGTGKFAKFKWVLRKIKDE